MRIFFLERKCLAPQFKEGIAIVEGGPCTNQDATLQRAIYSLGMATDNFNGSITFQCMQMQSVPFRSIQYSLSIYLSIYVSVYLCICVSVCHVSVPMCVCVCMCVCVYVSMCVCVYVCMVWYGIVWYSMVLYVWYVWYVWYVYVCMVCICMYGMYVMYGIYVMYVMYLRVSVFTDHTLAHLLNCRGGVVAHLST